MTYTTILKKDLDEFLGIVKTRLKDRYDKASPTECPLWFTASTVWSKWDVDPEYGAWELSRILVREAAMMYDLIRVDTVLMVERHQRELIENVHSLFSRVANHKDRDAEKALAAAINVVKEFTQKLRDNDSPERR